MMDLLCLGTVSIDIYYKGESLTEFNNRFELAIGGKYFVEHFYEGLGGGGANVAIGVAKHNLKVALIAKIGDNPFMPLICNKLKESNVEYKDFCIIESNYKNISSILLNKTGEKTIINYRTNHEKFLNTKKELNKIDLANNIYMANLSDISLEERVEILKYAKSKNKTVIANLNVTDCRKPIAIIGRFIELVDVLVLNAYEFSDLVKTAYFTIDFQSNIILKYLPFNKKQLLIITDGQKGSYAYKDSKVYFQDSYPVENVIDTTGSGDAYTAGFISEYIKSKDIKKALESGSKYATEILRKLGAN